MKTTIWYEDFKTFDVLATQLNNFVRAGNVKIIRFATNFVEVEGEAHILNALYNKKKGRNNGL